MGRLLASLKNIIKIARDKHFVYSLCVVDKEKVYYNDKTRLPGDWKDDQFSSRDDIGLESCMLIDRCNPNPCEHGGICKQTSQDFYCECENTG
jgi:hypothetical protein